MALRLHCIFDNPSVLPDIVKLVERTAHKLNSKKKSAKVEDVYNELRDNGFEIDAESVALAYQNVKNIMGRKNFSTRADVNRFGGEGMKSAIELANKGDIQKSRLGKYGITTAVSKGLAKTFSALKGRADVDKSRLFELQEMLRKKASSMLDKSAYPAKDKMSFEDMLKAVFDAENIGATTREAMKGQVQGMVSRMDEIWGDLQDRIDQISKGIKNKAERDQFEQMVRAIKDNSYDLLLTNKQADDVVKGLLKEAGFTKELNTPAGKREVIDWPKVLANRENWKDQFETILDSKGFSPTQIGRIMNVIEKNYNDIIAKQSEIELKRIQQKNNRKQTVKTDAIQRLIKYKNAGINLPANRQLLIDALGVNIPKEVADEVMQILDDYEVITSKYGNISNVYVEEVVRSMTNLLSKLDRTTGEKVIDGINDILSVKAMSLIVTGFNTLQNVTGGMMAAFQPALTQILKTKNPITATKLTWKFMKSWTNAFLDVSTGGVTIRDARTINSLEQMQGRGGLSDRWTFQTAAGFWGRVKASLVLLGQITATAADAANGTVIYNAGMIASARELVKQKAQAQGKSKSEVRKEGNKVLDQIIFGKRKAGTDGAGEYNSDYWNKKAKEILEQQEGVAENRFKAGRIAEELAWNELIENYGININQIKATQSASLEQKSKSLGHESDVMFSPANFLKAKINDLNQKAAEAKEKGNPAAYYTYSIGTTITKTVNMFVGGRANWAVLTIQNSPVGILLALSDMLRQRISRESGQLSLWRQPLNFDNPETLREQLVARKGIYGRLERGIYGTLLQGLMTMGILAALGGDDDDDDRGKKMIKAFDKMMQDPVTRRILDKAMPMILSAELAYAYDKRTNRLDPKKISKIYFVPKFGQLWKGEGWTDLYSFTEKNVAAKTGFDRLQESLQNNAKYIRNGEARARADAQAKWRYVGQLLSIPYFGTFDVVKEEAGSAINKFEPDPAAQRKRNQEYKQKLRSTENSVEAMMDGMGLDFLYEASKDFIEYLKK